MHILIKKQFSCALFLIAIFCIGPSVFAEEAARIFLDSRATNLDPQYSHAELILREIPRQSLLVALEQDLDRPVVIRDATIEPSNSPRADELSLVVESTVTNDREKATASVKLSDAQNPIDTVTLTVNCDRVGTIDYADFAEKMDDLVRSKWLSVIAVRLSTKQKPAAIDSQLPTPESVGALLETIDFHHAFLAARLIHSSIAASGESPARLAALVRAYAHLGESTRHLFNGQSTAFFARALVYGQRLARLAPDSAETWWTRAYAESLFSTQTIANMHLEKGDNLALSSEASPPSWVELVRLLIHYNTAKLDERILPTGSSLATYFAFLTVEHAALSSLPIKYARAALQQNPGAIRLEAAISDNSGVGLLHQTTVESPRLLNRMVSQLYHDADDRDIRDATGTAITAQFSQPAILALLDTFDKQTVASGQLLPWSTYAAVVRECEFADAFRRIHFVAHMWGVDPADEIQAWWPLIKNHRYALLISAIRNYGQPVDPEQVKRVAAIDFKDDVFNLPTVSEELVTFGINQCPRIEKAWIFREMDQGNRTANDDTAYLWAYRYYTGDRGFLRVPTTALESTAPDHPLVLAEQVVLDWKSVESRLNELERKYSQNPITAFALANGYLDHGQPRKAIPLLQKVVISAPDIKTYQMLAIAYLQTHDETSWQATWDQYLANAEDFGLDHSFAGQQVAEHFIQQGQFKESLPYAKIAADSYSSWGLRVYARALAGNREFDKAAEILMADAERYDNPSFEYRFIVTTGHGSRKDVAVATQNWFDRQEFNATAPTMIDHAVFSLAEGQSDQADAELEKAFKITQFRYSAIIMAARAMEKNKDTVAMSILEQALSGRARSADAKLYDLCIAEIRQCISDPKALPSKTGDLIKSFDEPDGANRQGNCAYVMGEICELRQKPDDARWWYRKSLDANADDFTYRALAGEALRRLGEDYFK